jgi:hypothetical protein
MQWMYITGPTYLLLKKNLNTGFDLLTEWGGINSRPYHSIVVELQAFAFIQSTVNKQN